MTGSDAAMVLSLADKLLTLSHVENLKNQFYILTDNHGI